MLEELLSIVGALLSVFILTVIVDILIIACFILGIFFIVKMFKWMWNA